MLATQHVRMQSRTNHAPIVIYLDNNATTRPAAEVVDAVAHAMRSSWGNPSSQHCVGIGASRAIMDARRALAKLVSASEDAVVFTSGATEANEGVQRHYCSAGYRLIVSETEHPAVSGFYRRHAADRLYTVPVDSAGQWDVARLGNLLAESRALVAVAWANGETGVVQDIAKVCDCASRHGAAVLVDASQAIGRIPIDVGLTAMNFLTLSGHKFHAPKGIGALVLCDAGPNEFVLQTGGGQERGIRGGTENVPGIVGLGLACTLRRRNFDAEAAYLRSLRRDFEGKLIKRLSDIRVNGAQAHRLPNTSNVCFGGVEGTALVARLENRNVICSQTSACTSGSPEPSSTLLAMGLSREEAHASVRFAFAVDNSKQDVDSAVEAIVDEVTALRRMFSV